MKKKDSYKENFNYNKVGRNRYGESIIHEDKGKKTFVLSLSTIDNLIDFAKVEKLTQSDVVELAIREYIEKRSKD